MRYFKVAITAIFLMSCFSYASDSVRQRNDNVQLNIGEFYLGTLEARYEHRFTDWFSLTAPVTVSIKSLALIPQDVFAVLGLLGFATFPDIEALGGIGGKFSFLGLYVEPLFKLGYAQIFDSPKSHEGAILQLSANIGFQHTFDFGLVVNAGFGAGGRYFWASDITPAISFRPDLSIALGYGW